MFFVDKYAPQTPEDIIFHKDKLALLKKMSDDNSVPHIIFCGPAGSGKSSLIKMFLEMLYNKDVNDLHESIYPVFGSGSTKVDVVIKQSNYHIVIQPNNNNFDRYIIQDVVKNYAKKVPLNVLPTEKTFKTVLINNVDNLSYYAQTSLRRTIEKFSGNCRFIMWCRSLSRVIDPIRSRCYTFRINSPSSTEILGLFLDIVAKENLKMNLQEYEEIIKLANGNIKKALWLLQLKQLDIPYITSYDEIITNIMNLLLVGKINTLLLIRPLLYNIMITNITGSQIIKDIIKGLLDNDKVNDQTKINMIECAAKFEYNLIRGRREIQDLEGFIAGLLCILNKYNK
jgi:replication factor C subunit 3/5